jgi:DNA (cytosine-5)-methyltransferase 1
MRFADWFAGGGGIRLGLERAGHECVWSCERDPFARRIYAARFGHAPESDDIETVRPTDVPAADLWAGGFPCQDLSVAGLRAGFGGTRSSLVFRFLDLAAACRPRWLLLENVPGLLHVRGGRDFAVLLAALDDLGYVGAWRVLDARHFGVPQRRRRVFLVCHLGDGADPAQVLFEPQGVRGHSPARGAAREDVARPLGCGASRGGGHRVDLDHGAIVTEPTVTLTTGSGGGRYDKQPHVLAAPALTARYGKGTDSDASDAIVSHTLNTQCGQVTEDGTGHGSPIVVAAPLTAGGHLNSNAPGRHREDDENLVLNWQASGADWMHPNAEATDALHVGQTPAVAAFDLAQITSAENRSSVEPDAPTPTAAAAARPHIAAVQEAQTGVREYIDAGTLRANGPGHDPVGTRLRVGASLRRLTPRERERLQGLPDDWTLIDGASDAARYRVIGNGVAVPVIEWIGHRLAMVETTTQETAA